MSLAESATTVRRLNFSHGWASAGRIEPLAFLTAIGVCVLSFATEGNPSVSWWLAWLGSAALLIQTLSGVAICPPKDLKPKDQVLRPWLLMQLIFVGYNCLTSIFFWFDINGYYYLQQEGTRGSQELLSLAAESQRCYYVGHLGLVGGLALGMRWRPQRTYRLQGVGSLSKMLIWVAIGATLGIYLFRIMPGFSQFAEKMRTLATVAASVSLGVAYKEGRRDLMLAPLAANALLLLLALSSGWKSEVIVLVLLNASVFYSAKPLLTLAVTSGALLVGLGVLPPIVQKVREQSWEQGGSQFSALASAFDVVSNRTWEEAELETWEFMTQRLSEESLFVKYLAAVPERRPYYGMEIIVQSALSPVPRIIWPSKPNLELLVKNRVVELEIVPAWSKVSAKPQTIVDGYLSFGVLGVAITMLIYGVLASFLSRLCEVLLGGYLIGGVAFNGLFGFMWNGTCFEFLVNATFWSVVLVILLFQFGRMKHHLVLQ